MSNQQHTPGPWNHIESNGLNRIVGPDGETLFLVGMYGQSGRVGPLPNRHTHISSICEEAANASLIAAAPELLAILEELIDIEGPQPGTKEWADKARAAIAKAKGGAA